MKTALAAILSALVLLGVLGFFGYELHKLTADSVQTHADLQTAQAANQTQAQALAKLQADDAYQALQMTAVTNQLQAISATQQTKRRAQAQVVANATPAEKDLLSSKLPAATLQLLKGPAATAGSNTSNHADNP